MQGSLPELSTQKVVNKHQKAKENIDKKKISNKQYYDAKKNTKTSKIKEGDIVICKQKPNNKLSPRFNPERFYHRGKAQQLRQEMTDAPSRVMCVISIQ